MAHASPTRALLFGVPAVLTGLAGILLTGAFLSRSAGPILPDEYAAVLAGGVGLLISMVLPLITAGRLIRAIGPERVHASAVRGTTVAAWNGALIAAAVGLTPQFTADTLRSHGAWIPGSQGTPLPALMTRVGDQVAPPPTSSAAPAADTLPTAPPSAAQPTEPAEPAVLDQSEVTIEIDGEQVLSASELFARRADAVVVVKSRATIDDAGPLAEMFKLMGQSIREGHGSGFVVDTDLIVTNQHVVEGASELAIVTRDGRTLGPVEALVIDADHDLALLHVPGLALPRVPLAAADPVPPVGADTFAIGAPLGLTHSLTRGIVSAHRDLQGTAFLQMQTTVAPGSSGGPLFDDHGRVVAVNTATRSPGLNLAVQVRYVHELLHAERSPQVYGDWKPDLEVKVLTVEGADLRPTAREALAGVLQLVAQSTLQCVETLPEDAQITLAVPPSLGEAPTVTGNLSAEALECIEQGTTMAATALQVGAMQLHYADGIAIHGELVRGEETLRVALLLGKSPSPAEEVTP